MVVTQTNHPPQANKRFYDINSYFSNSRASNDRAINLKNIVDHLNTINKTLISLRINEHILALQMDVKEVFAVVDMLTYLYELKAENAGQLANFMAYPNLWPEENLSAYAFTFADGQVRDPTTDKEQALKRIKNHLKSLLNIEVELGNERIIYIPVLRSARALLMDNGSVVYEDVLKNAVHQQYFGGKLGNKGEQIYTAQLFYDGVKRQKNGQSYQREGFREFEKFIGESFFQSGELEITAVYLESGKKEITVDLPNERKDVAIHDLGDGVQAIINLLFPVFTAREGSWGFIDEPELNLHPGFQNLFIRTLLENKFLRDKNLRYFINSHSNHILSELLLSGSDDAEIFVFSRRDKDSSSIQPFKGYEAATLELLGVLNTSTLLSNCSVWVEGVTDRLYIRAFLTAYLRQVTGFRPIEGLNYSFVEYGGSNLKIIYSMKTPKKLF